MKLLAFIFEQPSYANCTYMQAVLVCTRTKSVRLFYQFVPIFSVFHYKLVNYVKLLKANAPRNVTLHNSSIIKSLQWSTSTETADLRMKVENYS